MSEHTKDVSPCSWYLVAFVSDVTVGASLSLLLLRVSQQFRALSVALTLINVVSLICFHSQLGMTLARLLGWASLTAIGNYGQIVGPDGRLIQKPSINIVSGRPRAPGAVRLRACCMSLTSRATFVFVCVVGDSDGALGAGLRRPG